MSDVRWQQRLSSYQRALAQLDDAVRLMEQRELSQLEKQGVIQGFEYSYELGWKVLADYLYWQGKVNLSGPRDVIREAFQAGLIQSGEGWMSMLQDRNRTSHTYNLQTAEEILSQIKGSYHGLLMDLKSYMESTPGSK